MTQKNSGFEIKAEQRQSWLSIAMVWAGGMICVPCLMIGGVLVGGGLSFGQIIASILLGYGMICAYMIFIGMQACDTGLPVSVMASGALGEKGARYIISTILAIACIGWFGIQSGVCGSAFASLGANMLGYESASPTAVTICSLVWGAIMLVTACLGFKGLKWLNYLAVPALVVVCLYGIIASMDTEGTGYMALGNPGFFEQSEEEVMAILRRMYGDDAEDYTKAFKAAYPDQPAAIMPLMDFRYRPQALRQVEVKSQGGGAPVWNFLFTYRSTSLDGTVTALHCLDLPYVFNNVARCGFVTDATPEAIRLGDIMSSAWINFARTGNPNGEGVPQWPAYTPDKKATMLFDTECEVRYGFDAALQEVVARER